MIREMLTHAVDAAGKCVRCERKIPNASAPLKEGEIWRDVAGNRLVGMIVADYGGKHSYYVGEHDTNKECVAA